MTIPLAPGETLFEQGGVVKNVYLLLSGRVEQHRVEAGADGPLPARRVRVAEPERLLGIYEFLFSQPYWTGATALEPCLLYKIDAIVLNRLIYRYPGVRKRIAPLQIISRLRTIPMIGRLNLVALGFLADEVEFQPMLPEEIIYVEGELGERLYFIDAGQVKLEWADGQVNWLGNGAAFGLLKPQERGRTRTRALHHVATSKTTSSIITFVFQRFVAITGLDPDESGLKSMNQRQEVIDRLPIFQGFEDEQRQHLVGYFSHYYMPVNQLLVLQGEQADSLWVLMEDGYALIQALDSQGNMLISTRSAGMTYFCEMALLGQLPQESSVEAMAGSEWLRLHWSDFQQFDDIEPIDLREKLHVSPSKRHRIADEHHRRKYTWLQPGELLIMLSRRHWIAFLNKGIPSFVSFLLFLGLAIVGASIKGYQLWIIIPAGIIALVSLILFVWGAIDYFNDWIVVTDRRVVHQEKVLLINEWRKEAPLERIEQVDLDRTFLGRWLNYGTMIVQTASTTGKITFNYTQNFVEIDAAIKEQRDQRLMHSAAEGKSAISRSLGDRLGLSLELPSRVYRGGATVEPHLSWWERFRHQGVQPMTQPDNDRIIWRKHWLVLLPRLWWALLILLGTVVITALPSTVIDIIPNDARTAARILQFGATILTLLALLQVLWVIVNWYNDTYEVNDEMIMHVEQLPLGIRERRSRAGLGQIQNVTMLIPSPIHWLFNYGTVRCQTAAEEGDFDFLAVPGPEL